MDSRILSAGHARQSGVDRPCEASNAAWWDWCLGLGDEGDGDAFGRAALAEVARFDDAGDPVTVLAGRGTGA